MVNPDPLTYHQLRELAEQHGCTPGQLQVLDLQARGLSQRRIAILLNISRSTVRSRFEEAKRRINNDKEAA